MIKKLKDLPAGMRTYTLIWSGQFVSIIGSSMTDFALAAWILTTTGSATLFGVVLMLAILPGILVSLVSGALVDRWDRRLTLVVADSVSAVATLSVALLFLTGNLAFWHICIAATVGSVTRAFQMPAWMATTPLLVPAEHLGRASGMMNFARSIGQFAGPLLGGALFALVGLGWVMVIDFATFCIAMTTLAIARFPAVPRSEGAQAARPSLLQSAGAGWKYIWDRPSLRSHLLFFTLVNFCLSFVMVLYPPMVLGFADVRVLSYVWATFGAGMLLGSVYMTWTGGPAQRVAAMLGVGVAAGAGMLLMGVRPWAPLVAVSLFAVSFGIPILNGAFMRIWQPRIPADMQGRTFAAMQIMAWSSLPVAFLSGGILADRVFGPLLMPGGSLADSIGQVIGVGPGRGIALMLFMAGGIMLIGTAVAALRPHFRTAEDLPLALVPQPAPAAAPAADEGAEDAQQGTPVPA